jgi:hypothetical protein
VTAVALLLAALGSAAPLPEPDLALAPQATIEAAIADSARRVEEIRGRRFSRSVPAAEIDTKELERVLREKLAEGLPAPPRETLRTLAALGFVEDAPDLLERLLSFYVSQVAAFYDPDRGKFWVVKGAMEEIGADSAGMGERLLYSHELMHALQDQHLTLGPRMHSLKDDGDAALALQCLLEGEATLVMVKAALADLPFADGEEAEELVAPLLSAGALERSGIPKDVPEYFVDQLFFPYTEGTAWVRRAWKRGGWSEVDRLWKSPPVSTSEILHEGVTFVPAAGLLPPSAASLAPKGKRLSYTDTIGEWNLRWLLERSNAAPEAEEIAAGWRGDRIAFFVDEKSVAFLWRLRFDSPGAAARFEKAWKQLREARTADGPQLTRRGGSDLVVASGLPSIPALPGLPAPKE